jgi:D-glycero-D-manno-heptose 1,7-bisphosphate phosphatase
MAEAEPDWTRHLAEPGLWVQPLSDLTAFQGRPALFLDRDGTINVDTGYPDDPAGIALIPSILPVIRAARAAGMAVVIVTNQSGIARGLFGWDAFERVNRRVLDLLAAAGCRVDLVVACAYHEAGQGALQAADHPMRKPNPGMLLRAAQMAGLDMPGSLMVGDKPSDLAAGRRAGVGSVFAWAAGSGTPEPILAALHSGGTSAPSDLR